MVGLIGRAYDDCELKCARDDCAWWIDNEGCALYVLGWLAKDYMEKKFKEARK